MQISELAQRSGVSAKTIRYYESIGLLPAPARGENNYRNYEISALERLRFIVGARSLGFALADIRALLLARDEANAPCERVLHGLDAQLDALDRRIADLLALREELRQLRAEGERRPRDLGESGECVCHLVTAYSDGRAATVQRQEGERA
jgi:MerR family transcriptional regulator, copper efflux regulator